MISTHGSLIALNNGLGPLKTKSGGRFHGGGKVGGCVGGDFVRCHVVESRSLNGP